MPEQTTKTVAEFVAEVVAGEGGAGSVYLDGFSEGLVWSGPWYVGVATDSPEADYRLDVEPTDAVLDEVAAGLEAGGLEVIRDALMWQEIIESYGEDLFGDEDEEE